MVIRNGVVDATKPRSKRIQKIEARFGQPIEATLRALYYEEGLSLAQVGKRLRVPEGTVAGWMVRMGINQRAMADQRAKELSA